MLDKRYLKNSEIIVVDYDQLVDYRREVKKIFKRKEGWKPEHLPKKILTEFLGKEIGTELFPDGDSIVVFGFYHVDKDSVLIFSGLGVSVLTKKELRDIA